MHLSAIITVAAFALSILSFWVASRTRVATRQALFDERRYETAMLMTNNMAHVEYMLLRCELFLNEFKLLQRSEVGTGRDEIDSSIADLEATKGFFEEYQKDTQVTADTILDFKYSEKEAKRLHEVEYRNQVLSVRLRQQGWQLLVENAAEKLKEIKCRHNSP